MGLTPESKVDLAEWRWNGSSHGCEQITERPASGRSVGWASLLRANHDRECKTRGAEKLTDKEGYGVGDEDLPARSQSKEGEDG